jgi:uncharacterized RDD family membrane protein YckC
LPRPTKPTAPLVTTAWVAPSIWRYLAAICYDWLLLLAVLFAATALLLPFNGGQAFSHQQWFYPLYLLAVSFYYYGGFWVHGGQTLGLRAWRLKVLTLNHQPMNWQQAALRFIGALLSCTVLGLGLFWRLWDKNHRTWHDYLSGTTVLLDTSH